MLWLPRVGRRTIASDVRLYGRWAHGIVTWGRVPYRDFAWEYPPGAALFITPPGVSHAWYPTLFVFEMVLVDLLVLVALRRLGMRLGSDRGVALWIFGVLLLGPIVLARYDVAAGLFAVLFALALASGAPFAAGVALGGGVVTKLWPLVLALAVPFVPGKRRLVAGFLLTVAVTVLAVVAIGGGRRLPAVLEHQAARGLQVESVAATPLVVLERMGRPIDISLYKASGSWDVTGPGTSFALSVSNVVTLAAAGLVLVLAWRVRSRPEAHLDLVATAMLLVVVTGKVLSPQYVTWLLAVLAAALCRRGSPLWPPAVLVAVAALLGQVVYPVLYRDLVNGEGLVVVTALVARNVLLVVATALAVVRLWRSLPREQPA
ncbi:MAG: hypothetical protein QOE45_868 [Frankiaceae bacterium]|jgi:hypothetical protein|nr:hypothetical protein [Frankiaceae bacterium]